MIDFQEDDIHGLWFMATSATGDFMAVVRVVPEGVNLLYRFRTYETAGAFDGLDHKEWDSGLFDGDLTAAIAHVQKTVRSCVVKFGVREHWELLRGDMSREQWFAKFLKLPFVHKPKPEQLSERAWRDPDGVVNR